MPIDVGAVNEIVRRLKTEGEKLYTDVIRDYEQALLADSAILYANRPRQNFAAINDAVKQSESLYFDGDFKRAYEETLACIKRLRGE